jgi:NAD(P)H:quinone oxidoreductase type IV
MERMSGHRSQAGGRPVVVAAGLVILMAQLDATIVTVALPTIGHDLHAPTTVAEWIALAYVVPLIALTLPAGRWLDRVSHGRALTAGTIGFAAASAAAGLSPTIWLLIASRAAQGAFAALLLALAPVLAVESVAPEARGRALGLVSTLAPLGAVAGPVAGGVLVDAAGWPAIFYVNLPIAAAVTLVARTKLPRDAPLTRPGKDSLGEAALLGGAAVLVLLALSLAPSHGIAWLLLLAGAPPLLAGWRRTAASRPVRRLVRAPGMPGPHVALTASYTALLLVQFLAPFYLRTTLGTSAAVTGLTVLAYPAATALAGPVSGALTDRRGARPVALAGAAVMIAGLALVAPLGGSWHPLDLAWRLAAIGIGFGLFVTPVQAIALARAPRELVATTSATTSLARQLGIAAGPALGTAVWAASGYQPAGMRVAVAVAAAIGAVALASLVPAPARARRRSHAPAHTTPIAFDIHKRKETRMSLKVAVIYYSSTGNVHALAEAVAEGAADAGAEVRLRRVEELAPEQAIDSNPRWREHADATAGIPVAAHEDLVWADAYAFGTPARYGNVSSQLKQFIDTTAPLWAAGDLADKPATAFTSAINLHGGNESTLLALYNTMHHWGAVIVPPGYTDEAVGQAGGNPYGTAHASGDGLPDDDALEAARHQGRRLARYAAAIRAVRTERAEAEPQPAAA